MKVLVDTSVWADFFNDHDSAEARALAAYIAADADIATCGVVVAEFFQGLRRPRSAESLRPYFEAMLYLEPSEPDTYFAAADLFRSLRRRGITVRSMVDCLIARIAEENGASVLARDRDLHLILDSGCCETTAAPLIE